MTVDHNTRCVRSTEEPGCSHIVFPLINMSYSQKCGTVEGFGLVLQMVSLEITDLLTLL